MRFNLDLTRLPGSLLELLEAHEAHGSVNVEKGKVIMSLVARKLPGAEWGSVVADNAGIFVLFFDRASNTIGGGVDVESVEDGVRVLLAGPVVSAPVGVAG